VRTLAVPTFAMTTFHCWVWVVACRVLLLLLLHGVF